jgi:hypothetical protein
MYGQVLAAGDADATGGDVDGEHDAIWSCGADGEKKKIRRCHG